MEKVLAALNIITSVIETRRTQSEQASRLVMSREGLPAIGSSKSKTTGDPGRQKRNWQHATSPSHPRPGPSSILFSDTTMTPWGSLALSESSFTSIPPPPPPRPPPPQPPPAPQPTPSTPYCGGRIEEEDASNSSFDSEVTSPPLPVLGDSAAGRGRGVRPRRRVLPQHRVPHPPRLPPLRPVTNLSFSRSFTFSFFELPLHQTPRCRAERIRNLMLLLKQIRY